MGLLCFEYQKNDAAVDGFCSAYDLKAADARALLELLTQDAVYSGAIHAGSAYTLSPAEREYIFFSQSEKKLVLLKNGDQSKQGWLTGWRGRKRSNGNYYLNSRIVRLCRALNISEDHADALLEDYWYNVFHAESEEFMLDANDFRIHLGGTQDASFFRCKKCGKITPYKVKGMSLGRRISALSEWTSGKSSSVCESTQLAPESEPCLKLHRLFCGMPRYRFDQIDQIPFIDGIYIMFEAGERYHSYDRIVRVGTHTSDGRLKQRLRDHFLKENKDGSIFRKNIGKAILNKNSHPYLSIWTEDSRDRRAMHLKYGDAFDEGFQAQLEQQVSRYLRENITFTCIPVPSAEARLRYEEGIIASLHQAGDFGPGEQWRGRYSPVQAIRTSGLWLVQGLDATPLSAEEFQEIASLCGSRPVKAADSPAMASHQPAVKKEVPPGKQPGIHEVAAYLKSRIETADKSGEKYITLRSGEIHKELRLSNRMPTVCDAMYQLMKPGDTVIERPPKGRGSRLVITYQT